MGLSDENAKRTREDDYRIFAFVLSVLNTWLSIEVAYANGLVPETTYNAIEDDIRSWFSDVPGIQPYFERGYDAFPAQQETEVYRTLKRILNEHDRSGLLLAVLRRS